jgi:outer membrane protein TolC
VVELTQDKYQAGLTDFGNVLEAQRSLWAFQDQLTQSDGTVSINLVRLNKAMGGNWITWSDDKKNSSKQGEKK